MSWVLAEVVAQRVIQIGLKEIKANPLILDDIFGLYLEPEMESDYGQDYIDRLKKWFLETKIPVVQAWGLNTTRLPSYSIHLSNETEDESKAAMGDYFGGPNELGDDETSTTGTGVFNVMIDIGIHGNKQDDYVLWMYYILCYVLFKKKLLAERLGLRIHTYSASDYDYKRPLVGENIYTRWVRFKCTTQNFFDQDALDQVDDIETEIDASEIDDPDDSDKVQID